MHGLMNRAIQSFLRETYGQSLWLRVTADASLPGEGFEAMLHYDDALTDAVLAAAARALGRSRATILEDLGTWLVSSQTGQPLRRLLRFGGSGFRDFLHSLEDLPDRGRLAVSDLNLPILRLLEEAEGRYRLICHGPPDFSYVLTGVLRAMADDYGALVLLEPAGRQGASEEIVIQLLQADYAEGRRFELANGG